MKYSFSFITLVLLFTSCGNQNNIELTAESIQDSLNFYNEKLQAVDFDVRQDTATSNRVVMLSEEFYNNFPDNENVPEALFKAGEIANGMGKYDVAIKHWTRTWAKYPESTRASDALFLTGFTYDNDLINHKEAEKMYNLFLEKYPNSELAVQVEFLRDMLGKSDEELIEILQSKSLQ